MTIDFLNDDEETNEGFRGNYIFKDLIVSTKNKSVYTPDTMKETVLSLESELDKKLEAAKEAVEGTGWAIYQFNKMYIIFDTDKTARAGSYIKTPENIIILNAD